MFTGIPGRCKRVDKCPIALGNAFSRKNVCAAKCGNCGRLETIDFQQKRVFPKIVDNPHMHGPKLGKGLDTQIYRIMVKNTPATDRFLVYCINGINQQKAFAARRNGQSAQFFTTSAQF